MIARLHGIGMTEVRISETVEKTFAIAEKTLVIVGRIIATAEATDTTAEKIIRIAGRIGLPTKGISRATGDTDVTTEEISGVTEETDTTPEEISRVTEDSGVITKRIFERIVEFDGTTNNIIPQGQIAGTDTLLNITGMDIPTDRTEGEAGAKLTDDREDYAGTYKLRDVVDKVYKPEYKGVLRRKNR